MSVSTSEEYEMPALEAVLAGTMALMTGFTKAPTVHQQNVLAEKIFSNLCLLSQHPLVSPGFQVMTFKLRSHWLKQNEEDEFGKSVLERSRNLWHKPAETLQ